MNDLEQAKAYIRQRLEAETSMTHNLTGYMREAASRIADIAYRYKISPEKFRFSANEKMKQEVENIISWLKSKIQDTAFSLSVAYSENPEDKDSIIAYVSSENHGKTFAQRNAIYCNRFKYELEGAIAAALILGVAKDKLKQSIYTHFRSPYANPYFMKAIQSQSVATRLRSNGISYGTGRTNSMFTAINTLTTHAVAQKDLSLSGEVPTHAACAGTMPYTYTTWPNPTRPCIAIANAECTSYIKHNNNEKGNLCRDGLHPFAEKRVQEIQRQPPREMLCRPHGHGLERHGRISYVWII